MTNDESTPHIAVAQSNTPASAARGRTWPWVILLLAALAFGAYFRLVGLDWSEGNPLHPDENFLTMVTTSLKPPENLGAYFNSQTSTLNPYNNGYGLFVYGDLPIFITRYTADLLDSLCTAVPQTCPTRNNVPFHFADYAGIVLLGRALSALLDLFTLLFMFAIGRRLYGTRVGVLAALLGAATVLQIQQSHFYTADIFATFFVMAAFYFIIRFGDSNSWPDVIASGAASGLAMASRINVAPILGIVGIAALAHVFRQWRQTDRTATFESAIARIVVAAVAAAIVFRIFMPYAFDGLLKFDERWSNNMSYIRTLVSGEDPGGPPGVQWTDRTPIVFPLINIVFWGLGVPLGVAAWIGWAWAAWQTFIIPYRKHRHGSLGAWLSDVARSRHLLIWVWVTAYFVWQGTQWVKSIRYQLPIYPFLTLFAAAALIALWDWAKQPERRSTLRRVGAIAALAMVVLGAYAWATAFTEIYRQPTTRVAASEWIYDNVPTAATLHLQHSGTPQAIQLPFPNTLILGVDGESSAAPFEIKPEAGTVSIDSITINRLIDLAGDPQPESIRVTIGSTPDLANPIAQAEITTNVAQFGARGGAVEVTFGSAQLAPGNYFVTLQVVSGAPLQAESSTIAVETWDETVPVRVGGRDGFSIYHGLEVKREWEDVPEKLAQIVQSLQQSDYVTMSSNRAYGAMSRQPLRYPMTSEYYRLMFSGQLGFKLVAAIESYPTLGPLTFPDQETTQDLGLWPDPSRCPQSGVPQCRGLININLPPAEEAFSVYDHPRVLVFEKTAAFSIDDVQAKLGKIPLQYVLQNLSPKGETDAPNGLMLKDNVWQAQQQSGTWSDLFDVNSLLNQSPLIGAIVWYLVVALLGLAAFPLLFAILPGLRDRGYGVARIAGLLIVAFTMWFAASLQIVTFSRGWIAAIVIALIAIGLLAARRQREALRAFWRDQRRTILVEEALFAIAFAFFLFVRFGNPDLWHPNMGGEKPMDFAYLNAVIKSNTFPPYDPWFAGGQITYYYFGFVLVATLVKLLGIVPAIAYNFAIPTLFAMTALGAFSAAYNLVTAITSKSVTARPRGWTLRNPIVIGLIAAVFVTCMGNLGEAQQLTEEIGKQIVPDMSFKSSIPGVELIVKTATGFGKMLFEGKALNYRPEWWYFTPTREIPAPPGEAGPISEFPFFTFLYADLHAHMIAMPLTLLMLVIAISWLARTPTGRWSAIGSIGLGGLTVGALRATNTWDYPTYLLIGGAAVFMGTLANEPLNRLSTWAGLLARAIGFVALSVIFFSPFTRNYATAYSSAEIWQGSLTPVWAYLNIHLLFLFPIVSLLIWEMWRWGVRWWRGVLNTVWRNLWWVLALGGVIVIAAIFFLFRGGREVVIIAIPILVLIAALILRPRLTSAQRFWMFIVAVAVGLTLAVEVVVLKGDISRMNTTFKFYLQVWVLLGIGAAVALGWLAERLDNWQGWSKSLWSGCLWVLVGASFLYVPLATRGKLLDRWYVPDMPPGLDGMAYMKQAEYNESGQPFPLKWDYEVIRWLQDNVAGTPVVAEGQSGLYRWQSRMSINTGLPTIIGWDWHQRQQRSIMPGQDIDYRVQDVKLLYDSLDVGEARRILDQYGVRYIIVGALERVYYSPDGLAKFDLMTQQRLLRVAYQNEGATLYEVTR